MFFFFVRVFCGETVCDHLWIDCFQADERPLCSSKRASFWVLAEACKTTNSGGEEWNLVRMLKWRSVVIIQDYNFGAKTSATQNGSPPFSKCPSFLVLCCSSSLAKKSSLFFRCFNSIDLKIVCTDLNGRERLDAAIVIALFVAYWQKRALYYHPFFINILLAFLHFLMKLFLSE